MQRPTTNHWRTGLARLHWVAWTLLVAAVATAAVIYATGRTPASSTPVPSPGALHIAAMPERHRDARPPRSASHPPTTRVDDVPTISRLPADSAKLSVLHRNAAASACQLVPPQELPYPADFAASDGDATSGGIHYLSRRKHVFSVGLDITDADRQNLPALSGGAIVDYLHDQFMSIQVRCLKRSAADIWYFHPYPVAAAISYQPGQPTRTVNKSVAASLQRYRSLGLFLPEEKPSTPENLRTLVLVYGSDATANQPAKYEYVFIRGREREETKGDSPELHAFGTADDRTTLHHFQSQPHPARPNECTLLSLIYFTKFSFGGLYPADSATRRTEMRDDRWHAMADLDSYTRGQGWSGGFSANITRVLDAWLDNQLPDNKSSSDAAEDSSDQAAQQ